MLRTMLLVSGGLFATAGVLAMAWCALALMSPSWRATATLGAPAVGVAGAALLAASAGVLRISGRVGRRGDPAHAIDAAAAEGDPDA